MVAYGAMTRTRFDFTGQVAVLTGAARGIGRGAAEAFAAAGARVYVVDVDAAAGEEAVGAIRERGGQAAFVAADLRLSTWSLDDGLRPVRGTPAAVAVRDNGLDTRTSAMFDAVKSFRPNLVRP